MKLTNKFGLPEIVLRAMEKSNKQYSKGTARLSVTQLIAPPQISVLKSLHYKEMEEDAADRFWSLLGSAVHHILEQGADTEVVEQRLHAVVNGWEISGAIDVQEESDGVVSITDYKVTSAYKIMKGEHHDWECQQNIYAWLIKQNTGKDVVKIQICGVVRDWQKSNLGKEYNYPQTPIVLIDLPLWSNEQAESYITERVALHQEAELAKRLGDPLPKCTPEEQWAIASKWALMKDGGKRAVKLCNSEEEANLYLRSGMYVQYRPGKKTRCEGDYCGVARWCQQKHEEDVQGPAAEPEEDPFNF